MRKGLSQLRMRALGTVAWMCAALMLCALPLLFRNGFFDINRFKVSVVCHAAPCLLAAFIVALLCRPRGERLPAPLPGGHIPTCSLAALLLALLIACARCGFDEASLTGSEGRYCGLVFWLACGCAFAVMASGASRLSHIDDAAIICAGVVAALGFANALGADPLRFYPGISEKQKSVFLSTIGNADFFGAYLAMLFPLAGARYVLSLRRRFLWLSLALLMACGVTASRTDSSFLALHLSCAALLGCSGKSLDAMRRALVLWGLCLLVLPVMQPALNAADRMLSGLLLMLCRTRLALLLGALCLFGACLCSWTGRRGMDAPGRRLPMAILAVVLVAALVLIGVILWFTLVDSESELGAASALLRFDDDWGSRRGYVYMRSLRAYADYSPADRLFGRGVDLTKRILEPYADNPRVLALGTFNDAHCQPLQLLLTSGLFGALSFLTLYASMIRATLRYADGDALLTGVFASLAGYGVIMLLQVTQPILIATYLSLCALALSRLHKPKEGTDHEPSAAP